MPPNSARTMLLKRLLWRSVAPLLRTVDAVAGWGVLFKVRVLCFGLVVAPALASLVLLESHPDELHTAFALALVLGIVFFGPLTEFLSHLLIRKELKEIERFCTRLKQGDYAARFALPHESDDEHELTALKRNLNWMAHVISQREHRLHAALEGAHEDRSRFEALSNVDPLTRLANRRRFESRLTELIHEAAITKRPLSLMFIDCDKFKRVNDTLGHQAGDALLQRLAELIRRNVREHVDLPFRYGGDEFGVVCVGVAADQAAEAAERIRLAFNADKADGASPAGRAGVTLSIGVTEYAHREPGAAKVRPAEDAARIAAFIKAADEAAYAAKGQGGDRIIIAKES